MFSLRSNAPPPSLRSGGKTAPVGRSKKEARMARPKIAADRLRTATIGVRVSPAEYAALKEKATTMGMTPAQWLRAAALARQLPPPPAPPVNLDTYRELGRIGNNLNQVVARINAGDAPAEIPRDIAAGLVRLVKTIQLQVLGGAE